VTNELLRDYYDTEWGLPIHDEAGVFERLVLEGFQAGLSWRTILAKRDAFREAFEGFILRAEAPTSLWGVATGFFSQFHGIN